MNDLASYLILTILILGMCCSGKQSCEMFIKEWLLSEVEDDR